MCASKKCQNTGVHCYVRDALSQVHSQSEIIF